MKRGTHVPVSFAEAEETENDQQCCRHHYPPDNPDQRFIVPHPSPGHRCCQWSVPIDCLSLCAHQQNVKYLIIACFRQNVKHFLYLWKLKLRAWIKNSLSTITRIVCVCVEIRRCHVVNLYLSAMTALFIDNSGKSSWKRQENNGSVCWVPCFPDCLTYVKTPYVPLKILALKIKQ